MSQAAADNAENKAATFADITDVIKGVRSRCIAIHGTADWHRRSAGREIHR
jgi:hypothetical protein